MAMLSHFSIQQWGKFKYNYFKSKGSSSNNIAQTVTPKPSKQNDKATKVELNTDCREEQFGSLYSEIY